MTIRNRVISLLLRIAFFVISVVLLSNAFNRGVPSWELLCQSPILSMIMLSAVLGAEIIANLIDLRRGVFGLAAGIYMPIHLGVTFYCILSSCLSLFGDNFSGLKDGQIFLFDLCLLLIPVIDWLFLCEKGTVNWHIGFNYAFIPLFYWIFIIIRPVIFPDACFSNGTMYPYSFFAPSSPSFLLSCLIAAAIVISGGFLMVFLNKVAAGYFKRPKDII